MSKIFISSTCNNLLDTRELIKNKLNEKNINTSLSELPEFNNNPKFHPHDSCLIEIDRCDALIAIIGDEFGKTYGGKIRQERAEYLAKKFGVFPSISWMEMDYAIEKDKNIFILMKDEIYKDMKYFRANGSSKNLNLLKVKDTRIFEFIHYFNNKEEARWIKFYSSLKDLDRIVDVISERVSFPENESVCTRNIIKSIMPSFQYRSRNKVALINIYNNWDNYIEKMWLLKSYLFERGFETEIFNVDINTELLTTYSQFSIIIVNLNVYNLITTCRIFTYIKKYSNTLTFVIGSFSENNYKFLKKKFSNKIDVVIPYNNIKGIYNFLLPFLNFDCNVMDKEDLNKLEQVAFEKAKNFVNQNSIISLNPTVAFMYYSGKESSKAIIYTTKGCRKNCDICGTYLYRQHAIIQMLDENILEQVTYLYDLGIKNFYISDEDIFCCGYSRIEKLLSLLHQYFEDINFEINVLITNEANELKINMINTLYNYGLKEITYVFCQETDAEQSLDDLNKILENQTKKILSKVIIYLGKYKETNRYYNNLIALMKKRIDIVWDIRFEIPEIINGQIPDIPNYKVWTNDIKLYNAKNPVMIYQTKYDGNSSRYKRNMMLNIYNFASEQYHSINPPISELVQEGFRDFSKSYNNYFINTSTPSS